LGKVALYGLFVGLVFVSILLHEAAHAGCAALFGHTTRGILLHPLGGVAFIEADRATTREDLIVSAAGPLVNLGVGGVLMLSADSGMLRALGTVNVMLGVYNLFPLFPLDGGRILKAVLTLKRVDTRRKRQLTLRWSRLSALVLAALAVVQGSLIMLACAGLLWVVAHASEGSPVIPSREIGRLARRAGRGVRALATRAGLCVPMAVALAVLASSALAEPIITGGEGVVEAATVPNKKEAESQVSAGPSSEGKGGSPPSAAKPAAMRHRARHRSPDRDALLNRLAVLERRLQRMLDATSQASAVTREDFAVRLAHLRTELTEEIDGLASGAFSVARELENKLLEVQEAHRDDLSSLSARVSQLEEEAAATADSILVEKERAALTEERLTAEVGRLSASLRRVQAEHLAWMFRVGGAIVGVCLLLVLLVWVGRRRDRRFRQLLKASVRQRLPTERLPAAKVSPGKAQDVGAGPVSRQVVPTVSPCQDSACLGEALADSTWQPPGKQLEELLAEATSNRSLRHKPSFEAVPWNLGFTTHVGPIRQENQDYALAFEVNGHQVVIAADGVGGVPHGKLASFLAATAAAKSVISALGTARRSTSCDIELGVRAAIAEASGRLRTAGDELGINDLLDGLRTTLIVVVGSRKSYAYAYIGDGGGCVLRRDGSVDSFIVPQKAGGGATNILAASLGPVPMGKPETGTLTRKRGDLLVIGTDGVFDRAEKQFPKTVLMKIFRNGGSLQDAAEALVGELADYRDEEGHVFDDNVTVCLMAGKEKPELADGFWDASGVVSSPCKAIVPEVRQCR